MIISAKKIAFSVGFRRVLTKKWIFPAALVVATVMMPHAPDARIAPVKGYDGTWNVVFTTLAGNCSATNSAPFAVSERQVSSAGGGKVTGGIGPAGAVAVRISVGLSAANGTGRLIGNSGTGRWSGIISGDRCRGTWVATRS
jgi:hypothetical protein